MDNNLDRQELEMLMEAVRAWESESTKSGIVGDLIGAMLVPPEKIEEFKRQRETKWAEAKKEQIAREEILIKG